MVDVIISQRVEEAVLRRWAASPSRDSLALRGGLLMQQWVGRDRRPADDVDFLALYPFQPNRILADLRNALEQPFQDGVRFDIASAEFETIFAETDFPGIRCQVAATLDSDTSATYGVQIDVGFHDPVFCELQTIAIDSTCGPIQLLAPRVEDGFAWKLHGLVERDDGVWRPKDLADLWMIGRLVDLDATVLAGAISLAFESRDAPMWRLDRLMNGSFGLSRQSRRQWSRWMRDHREVGAGSDLSVVVETVAAFIEPLWPALRGDEVPGRYAESPGLEETLAAVADDPSFVVHTWPNGHRTIVYERQEKETFPEPLKAATRAEFRRRQLLRECRGITFDRDGQLLARPFPKFFGLKPDSRAANGSIALEKLDGSLVFPTPVGDSWVWRTRRGPSDIAEAAGRHAALVDGDYHGFVQWCLERRLTPLFEWCSRSQRIVLDHAADRLVLTAVRRLQDGEFLLRREVVELARQFGVEMVRYLGEAYNAEQWRFEVSQWMVREGCVLVQEESKYDGGLHTLESMFKLKSDRYRLLHRAVEGPGRDRARWTLVLDHAKDALCETSRARGVSLEEYVRRLETQLCGEIKQIRELVRLLPDRSAASRKQLAAAVADMPGFRRKVAFADFDGMDAEFTLRRILREACENESRFQQIAASIDGPRLADG